MAQASRDGDAKLTDLLQKLGNCPKVLPAASQPVLGGVLAALPLLVARVGVSLCKGGAPGSGHRPASTAKPVGN